jgi:tetratricopeptide (TPR) repeat protein
LDNQSFLAKVDDSWLRKIRYQRNTNLSDLERAIELIKAGDYEEGRAIIIDILHEDYDNAQAWFWLAGCAIDEEEYGRALREVLRIEPENAEARRLAISLARESAAEDRPAPAPQVDEKIVTERKQPTAPPNPVQLTVNALAFLVVIGVAAALGLGWLYWQRQNEDNAGTSAEEARIDLVTFCTDQIEYYIEVFPARCGMLGENEICMANASVNVAPLPGDENRLLLAGDRMALDQVDVIETSLLDLSNSSWGIAHIQTNLESSDSPVTFLLTSGVTLSNFEETLQTFTFRTNPTQPECNNFPPPGLLISTAQTDDEFETAEFTANEAIITLSGTIFLQVDVARGFSMAVLGGEASIGNEANTVEAEAGQLVRWDVASNRTISSTTGEILTNANPVRGDLGHLHVFGETLSLDTDNWLLPGETPRVAINPTPTNTATPTDIPDTTTPTSSPTSTTTPTLSGQMDTLLPSQRQTASSSPPSVTSTATASFTPTTRIPTFTPTITTTTTRTANQTPSPSPDYTNTPDLLSTFTPLPSNITIEDPADYLSGTWECTVYGEENNQVYTISFNTFTEDNRILATGREEETTTGSETLEGVLLQDIPLDDVMWETVPNYAAATLSAWLRLSAELDETGDEETDELQPEQRILRLLLANNGRLSGALFFSFENSDSEQLFGYIPGCERQE